MNRFIFIGAMIIGLLLVFLSAKTHSQELKQLENKYGTDSYEVACYLKAL